MLQRRVHRRIDPKRRRDALDYPGRFRCVAGSILIAQTVGAADALQNDDVQAVVAQAVRPTMKQYGIPGMAVGITVDGRRSVFDYGVASKATSKHVDASTLFEIGSITKTFTASLVSYAQLTGKLSCPTR